MNFIKVFLHFSLFRGRWCNYSRPSSLFFWDKRCECFKSILYIQSQILISFYTFSNCLETNLYVLPRTYFHVLHSLDFSFVCRASHLGLLYLGSLVVLLVYSILYGLTAKDAHWLGAITSAAVIILGMLITAVLILFLLFTLLSWYNILISVLQIISFTFIVL